MKYVKRAFMLLATAVVAGGLVGCAPKTKTSETEIETSRRSEPNDQIVVNASGSEKSEQTEEKKEVTTITFAIPDFCHMNNKYVKMVNQELLKDGHPYQLEFKSFEYDLEENEYFENLEKELKDGSIDVTFLGFGDSSNSVYKLINSGAVQNLDQILTSGNGKVVYDAFPKALWEGVKCNGHIYSIPNSTATDDGLYVAFNRKYISDDVIEKWDGTIEGLYEIVRNVKWDDEAAPRVQYLVSDYDFCPMIHCEIRNGLLYDYDSVKIENPLESEKFVDFLQVLDQMKNKGYFSKHMTYFQNLSYVDEAENLESGNFLVVIDVGVPNEMYQTDGFTIKTFPSYIATRINGSIGISSSADNIDDIMDFLGLLYGESKYGNILVYGMLNENYQIKDGLVVNMDGSDIEDNYLAKMCINLFANIYPVKDENFKVNRKKAYFSFYDDVKNSPFIGFQAASSNSAVSDDLDGFLQVLKQNSMKEALKEFSEKLKADGIDEYLNTVITQWETYQKG